MRTVRLITLLFLFATYLQAEDKLILNNGSQINGNIVSIDDNQIVIDRGGSELTLQSSSVKEVIFDENSNIKDTPSFGITLGFPNLINLTAAYSTNKFHTRLSGGIIPTENAGIQGLIGYPIYGSSKALIAPSFFIGATEGVSNAYILTYYPSLDRYYESKDDTYSYYGFGVDLHFYGVTAFLGYGFELDENIHGNNFIFDIGYKYSWY